MNDRDKQLILVSELYYMQDMSQKEISAITGISRPSISRFLEEAKQRKLVKIKIENYIDQNYDLSRRIQKKFGLKYCCVVKNTAYIDNSMQRCAMAAADFLNQILHDNMILGVCIGPSVTTFADCLTEHAFCNVQVVQLTGCLCTGNPKDDGVQIAISIARKLNASYTGIYAPLYVGSKAVQEYFLNEAQISLAMRKIRSADVALMGIGSVSKASSVVRNNHISEKELDFLIQNGCRAQLMGRMVCSDGSERLVPDKYVIAPPLEELRNVNWTIGLATSAAKTDAVRVAIENRYINTLFIGEDIGNALIAE